jgi:hypothetical protein
MLLAWVSNRHCTHRANRPQETPDFRNNPNAHRVPCLSSNGKEWRTKSTLGRICNDVFDLHQLWLELAAGVRFPYSSCTLR